MSTLSTPEPSPKTPAPAPPTGKKSYHRAAVLTLVAAATLTVVALGVSWLHYRYQNTVISTATVKGRLHRMGARIDGQVRSIPVTPGQRVNRGDLLIQLEDSHYVAAVGQARSELNSAIKRLEADRLAIEHDRERLQVEVERCESEARAAASEVDAMTSTVNKWEREFERIASLIVARIASTSDMDQAKAERDNARAQKKSAESRLEAARATCRTARVNLDGIRVREAALEVAVAQVETSRQRLAAAEADLAATSIRAPEEGWVIDRIVESGGSAKVGEPILSLWLGSPWIEAWADEKLLRQIQVGSPVDVSLKAYPDAKLSGKVESIGVLTDREVEGHAVPTTLHAIFPRNAMVPVRVALDPAEVRFQPGLSALVGIRREAAANSTTASLPGRAMAAFSTPEVPSSPAKP